MDRGKQRVNYLVAAAILVIATSFVSCGIDLCSFRAPVTDLTTFFMTLNYSYLDLPDTPHVDVSSGRFSASFSHTHDDAQFALSTAGNAEISFDHFEVGRVLGDAFVASRFYIPEADALFVFAEVKADYADTVAQSGLEFRLGTGVGRLTDVSPLARAIRIQSTLIDNLALSAPLSDETLLAIGSRIGQESRVTGIGALVSEIESLIQIETGAVLDTRALLGIAEQIRSEVVSQQCGWIAQIGVGYEILRRFGGTRLPLLTFSTDFSRALSLTSQVGLHADVSAPLTIPTSGAFALTVSSQYTRRLTETMRLVAEYALQHVRQISGSAASGETVEVQLLLDLGRVDLTLSGALSRGTGSAGWTELFSAAVRVDLL